MLAWRAVREEHVLQKGLKGYGAYMARVRYRLIPHSGKEISKSAGVGSFAFIESVSSF